MSQSWQAAEARHRFSEVVDAAVSGKPQFIRRRDGREVVLVSREYFERTKANLRNYLLSAGYAGAEEDAFDAAMRLTRADTGPWIEARAIDVKD
jgi:prevent-host-death family protein